MTIDYSAVSTVNPNALAAIPAAATPAAATPAPATAPTGDSGMSRKDAITLAISLSLGLLLLVVLAAWYFRRKYKKELAKIKAKKDLEGGAGGEGNVQEKGGFEA